MKQNIKCADGEDICVFCAVGDNLEDPDYCEYDDQKTKDGCPGFECSAQCRECPMDCEFLGK